MKFSAGWATLGARDRDSFTEERRHESTGWIFPFRPCPGGFRLGASVAQPTLSNPEKSIQQLKKELFASAAQRDKNGVTGLLGGFGAGTVSLLTASGSGALAVVNGLAIAGSFGALGYAAYQFTKGAQEAGLGKALQGWEPNIASGKFPAY